jgi:hypothetical protein
LLRVHAQDNFAKLKLNTVLTCDLFLPGLPAMIPMCAPGIEIAMDSNSERTPGVAPRDLVR